MFPLVGAQPNRGSLFWRFPSGCRISFSHLQHEQTVLNWMGAEVAFIGFDEITHFTAYQFWYLLSRNRSTSGVRPYVRATCNPDADSWVAQFIEWWLDEDGFPIPERSGVVRYFVRVDDTVHWADTREALYEKFPHLAEMREKYGSEATKSFTFIPSRLTDNPALLEKDPGYLANLMALPLVERERLLGGNWKIRAEAGKVFNRAWFSVVPAAPAGGEDCRGWDFAATEKQLGKKDPDYTASVKIRKVNGRYYILDCTAEQIGVVASETALSNTTQQDATIAKMQGARFRVRWGKGRADAGKRDNRRLVQLLAGYDAAGDDETGDKVERAKGLAAQAMAGNVSIVAGPWNEMFLSHMHGQPDLPHDDIMDAATIAFRGLEDKGRFAHQTGGMFASLQGQKIQDNRPTSRRIRKRIVP